MFDGYIDGKRSLCLKLFCIPRGWWLCFFTNEWNIRLLLECHLMWANVNIWNVVLKLKNKSTWMLEAKEWEKKKQNQKT